MVGLEPVQGLCYHAKDVVCDVKSQFLSRGQLFVTPMGWVPPASSVRGILQARILQWVAIPIFSTQGSNPGPLHCTQILYCLSQQGSLV